MADKRMNTDRAELMQAVREWHGIARRHRAEHDRIVRTVGFSAYLKAGGKPLDEIEAEEVKAWQGRWEHRTAEVIAEMRDARASAPTLLPPSIASEHERGKFYGAKVGRGQGQSKPRGERSS